MKGENEKKVRERVYKVEFVDIIQDNLKKRDLFLSKSEIRIVIDAIQDAVEDIIISDREVSIGTFLEIKIKDIKSKSGIQGIGKNKGQPYTSLPSSKPIAKLTKTFADRLIVKENKKKVKNIKKMKRNGEYIGK